MNSFSDHWKCELCPSEFKKLSDLRYHEVFHMGKRKLYECQICPAVCMKKFNFNGHFRSHLNPITCELCGTVSSCEPYR